MEDEPDTVPDVLRAHTMPYPLSMRAYCQECGRVCWLMAAWWTYVGLAPVVCEDCLEDRGDVW